jgi:hypothetical protein
LTSSIHDIALPRGEASSPALTMSVGIRVQRAPASEVSFGSPAFQTTQDISRLQRPLFYVSSNSAPDPTIPAATSGALSSLAPVDGGTRSDIPTSLSTNAGIAPASIFVPIIYKVERSSNSDTRLGQQ